MAHRAQAALTPHGATRSCWRVQRSTRAVTWLRCALCGGVGAQGRKGATSGVRGATRSCWRAMRSMHHGVGVEVWRCGGVDKRAWEP
eukprot:352911-Chlamydomonas_euryale.AAC.9